MSKKNQILAALLIIQALLIVGIGVGKQEATVSAPVPVFPGFDDKAISKITVSGPVGIGKQEPHSVTLEKSADGWVVPASGNYPVKPDKVEKFLSAISKLKTRGPVISKSSYHGSVEVADDKHQRKVVLEGGPQKVELYLGSSPGFQKLHVRKLGEDDVHLVEGLSTYDIGPRGSDWVDRVYIHFEESDVWSVRVKNGNGELALEKDPASGEWAALGVDPAQANQPKIDDLVRKSRSFNLEEPVGTGSNAAWGLDTPSAQVTLVTGTSTIAGAPPPSTETVTVKVGNKDDEKNRFYIQASTKDHVVLAPSWAVEALMNTSPKDLIESDEKK